MHTETATTTSLYAATTSDGCRKCGIIKKSGKRSCCARGGDWFNNCGDDGERSFGHTWAAGIQACKGFPSSSSVDSSLQVNIHRGGNFALLRNHSDIRNARQHRASMRDPLSASIAGSANLNNCARLARNTVCVCVLFVFFT